MSSGALFCSPIEIATGGALTYTSAGTGVDNPDPAAWLIGSTYALGVPVTVGESIYQSLQASNTGHNPTDAGSTWWVRVGAINKMKMFDRKVGSQTENPDSITAVITPAAVVNVVSLRNLQALSISIAQSTTGEGTIYQRTIQLDEPVVDWYDYFYSDVVLQTEAVFTGLISYSDSAITVVIENPGGTAKCGEMLMGAAMEAGKTEAGLSDGIDDYSLIAPDEFGVRDIVERDYSDNMELTVYVRKALSPSLKRFLTQNRARPILVIAGDARPDAQVYGLAESWRRVLPYPDMDVFNITMKGLT